MRQNNIVDRRHICLDGPSLGIDFAECKAVWSIPNSSWILAPNSLGILAIMYNHVDQKQLFPPSQNKSTNRITLSKTILSLITFLVKNNNIYDIK
jgi:hypothetical protein